MKSAHQKACHSHGRRFFLGFSILILLGGLAPARIASGSKLSVANYLPALDEDDRGSRPSKSFTCLPKDVQLGDVVSYRPNGTSITVEKKLIEMKARCWSGKLVDARRREIRFFHPSCWGNPPPDYLEIRQREDKEVGQLRKRYTVIVFACNPMTQ